MEVRTVRTRQSTRDVVRAAIKNLDEWPTCTLGLGPMVLNNRFIRHVGQGQERYKLANIDGII